ncbi:MAG: hypothetical protein KF678_13345 [Phycisphaeraceae bacterium]|nr:hypothetical protein [Phycisphaeraceae bacterium]
MRSTSAIAVACLLAMAALARSSLAQECQPYWKAVPVPADGFVNSIYAADFGEGHSVYGAGFGYYPLAQNPVRRWDGFAWQVAGAASLGSGVQNGFRMLHDGQGLGLYYIGVGAGQVRTMYMWRRHVRWRPVPFGMYVNPTPGHGVSISPMFSTDQEGIAGLYGVERHGFEPERADWILRWTGEAWKRIGRMAEGSGPVSYQPMFTFDFGEGPELIVSGFFEEISGVPARGMARWNGHRWLGMADLPGAHPTAVFWPNAMCAYDDGVHGLSLYAGFRAASPAVGSGLALQGIVRWNGSTWVGVGGGVGFPDPNLQGGVFAMTVFDDGTGPALIASGAFSLAGGVPARNIAKWNGQVWAPLGAGIGAAATQMAVANDGRGESLFVVGDIFSAGGGSVTRIAQYVGCKGGQCYADCDNNRILNANDFICFLNTYAAKDPYANCDGSTVLPVMTAADFQCFLNKYAQGCP